MVRAGLLVLAWVVLGFGAFWAWLRFMTSVYVDE